VLVYSLVIVAFLLSFARRVAYRALFRPRVLPDAWLIGGGGGLITDNIILWR